MNCTGPCQSSPSSKQQPSCLWLLDSHPTYHEQQEERLVPCVFCGAEPYAGSASWQPSAISPDQKAKQKYSTIVYMLHGTHNLQAGGAWRVLPFAGSFACSVPAACGTGFCSSGVSEALCASPGLPPPKRGSNWLSGISGTVLLPRQGVATGSTVSWQNGTGQYTPI